jgi:hypothetical protein
VPGPVKQFEPLVRHAAGHAGATESPATWSDDQVMEHIVSVAGIQTTCLRVTSLSPSWTDGAVRTEEMKAVLVKGIVAKAIRR